MSMVRYVFTVSVDKDTADCGKADIIEQATEYQAPLEGKNTRAVNSFLGTSRLTSKSVVFPVYYGELLAWALKRYLERNHWQVISVPGYHYSEPVYENIYTDYHRNEELLLDGQLLIDNGNYRLVITADVKASSHSLVIVEGGSSNKREIKEFADGIKYIVEKENYYREKRVEFSGRIRFKDFKDIRDEVWRNIDLSPSVKAQIKAGIVDLFDNKQIWTRHGLPLKRCVLIAGGAKKDKASICRALMAEAVGITCIVTNARDLDYDYSAQLYQLARDLNPCIVFIEDIDFIGQKRINSVNRGRSGLTSLLTLLGSVEEHEGIVTVATATSVSCH
ncbi:MAG TPA: AAA family ATPase [Desulfosporosinus sp.]|nr:AAA family ATPase [Desulfosporosinus sp.]